MKRFSIFLILGLLYSYNLKADDNTSQEYYEKQIADSMETFSSQLQVMTDEMVKYMNALNKAIDESVPQMSSNLVKIISSMKPLADNMQKNINDFAKQINQELEASQLDTSTNKPNEQRVISSTEVLDDTTLEAIDVELANFEQPQTKEKISPKIKLFSTSVDD